MEKQKKKRILLVLFICIVVLFGCSRTRNINKISIVHIFGFDQSANGELIGSALLPDYTKSRNTVQIQYLEEQASTSKLLVSKMSAHTSTPVELAKIRVLVFGKDYAEAGIGEMVERLIKNPEIGTNIQIAASTHSARETLNIYKKEKSFTLSEQIQQNMQGQSLPEMNLHIFLNHFYGQGMDAYLPMLDIDKKERLMVEGIGVLKNDKLKLLLNPEQSALFSFIKDQHTQATYQIELDKENNQREIFVVRSARSKKSWDWDQKREQLKLRLQLEMSLPQFPNRFKADNPEDLREMRKLIVEKIEKGIVDLLATFQENEVDPIGIGNIVRSKDKTWEAESFYKQYPALPIHVNVDLKIIHTGL